MKLFGKITALFRFRHNLVTNSAEAERKKYMDQYLCTEQELAAAKGREKSLQEQLLKDVNDSQERFKKQLQMYSELEVFFHVLFFL